VNKKDGDRAIFRIRPAKEQGVDAVAGIDRV
jgi:hypothetical protein